jgi:hypothetical protein
MRGIARRRLAAMIALALLAAGVFLASRLLEARGLVWATNVTTIASFVLAAAIAIVPLLRILLGWLHGGPTVSKITLQQARAGLADALAKELAEEDRLRQVYDPWPLPVRWHVANTAPTSVRPDGSGTMPTVPTQIEAAERFADIHTTFMHAPGRRMVILGAAGAGKSVLAIKLIRDLLSTWEPTDRVPVLLPAATWTRNSTMTEWITEQLIRSQPSLDVQIRTDTGQKVPLPRALADSGIIPVIDGLDELPLDRQVTAISEINAYGSDYPLVLTSRPEEYYATIAAARGVSQAVVIELEPLEVPELEKYLIDGTSAPPARWRRVFDRLGTDSEGALAMALATPLMTWLARTAYEKAESDPDELLDPIRLADREAIESHLVAAFIPAVYSERRRRSRPWSFRCTPEQATRWLGFLADRLNRNQIQEIAWWRLPAAEPAVLIIAKAMRAVLYTCIFWQVSVWALTRRGYWRHGSYVGHGHYQDLLLAGLLGHAVRPLTDEASRFLARTLGIGTVDRLSSDADSVLRSVAHIGLFPIACLMACCGIASGLMSLDSGSVPAPQTLRMTWPSFRGQVLGSLLLPALATAAFASWYASAHHQAVLSVLRTSPGRTALLLLGLLLARSLTKPIEVATKADPASLLRMDRRVYLAKLVAMVIGLGVVWLWTGGVLTVAYGVWSAAGVLIVLLLGGTSQAWTRYLDVRLWLAVRGRLPWRTISFLADAHQRGVLRQTGGFYQFRHIRLQEQLADSYSPWPRLLRPFLPALSANVVKSTPGTGVDSVVATEYAASGEVHAISRLQRLSVRLQAVSAVSLLIIAVAVTFVLRQSHIPFLILVAALLLAAKVAVTVNKFQAISILPPGYWAVHVTPEAIELTLASRTIKLTADDVEMIAVRPLGNSWFTHAVQAKLRSGLTPCIRTPDNWLPLYWTPRYTARVPRALVSALAGFGGRRRLEPKLASWLKSQKVTEFEAGGTLEIATISATLGRPLIAATVAMLALTGLSMLVSLPGLASVAIMFDSMLIGICSYRLSPYMAKRKLPSGPWSLHVYADAIDVTHGGRSIRLSPNDIESIKLREIGGPVHAVYARLRFEAASRLNSPDGWLPLYWQPDFSKQIPANLAISLSVFAPGRLVGALQRRAERAQSPKAPVDRYSWP